MSKLLVAMMHRAGIPMAGENEGAGGGAGSGGGAGAGADKGAGGGGDQNAGGSGAAADGGAGPGAAADGGNKGAEQGGGAGETPEQKAAREAEAAKLAKPYEDDPKLTPEKNAEAKAAHEKAQADAKAAEYFGAPEKYADLVVPEGMTLDQDAANEIHGLAKQLNLSQKTVDQLVDVQKQLYERQAKKAADDIAATEVAWTAELKADPVLGGNDHDAKLAKATEARNTFGTPGYNQFLKDAGLENHPDTVRTWYAISQALGEGSTVKPGGGQQQGERTAQDRLNDMYKPRKKAKE